MLPNGNAKKFQNFVKNSLGIPHFKQGIHFYLDIDYKTYCKREKNRKKGRLTVNSENFKERRARYRELCDCGYLELIDATMCEDAVADKIQEILIKQFDTKRAS